MSRTGRTQLDLSGGWTIDAQGNDAPARTAAAELDAFLSQMSGRESSSGPVRFELRHRTSPRDSFTWNIDGSGRDVLVRLSGSNARGLLQGVYTLLNDMGCAWPGHRPQDARVPRAATVTVPAASAESAAFDGRCLILGHHVFLAEYEAWIIWAARNRLNTIFVHTAEDGLALGAAPAGQWHAVRGQALQCLERHGMTLELGGHGLKRLLPRDLFDKMPDAFRMKDGARTPDHNLDPLSAEGMAVVRDNARKWFQAHPEAEVYHLWPDDIPGGGWSESPECEGLTPSDQALIATNVLGEALEDVEPAAEVAHIAYHDTEPAPEAVRPRRNVSLLWAPRMRCYAQDAGDLSSPVNRTYPERLAANIALFADAGARPPRVFEYYLDAILFKSVLPPLPAVITADAEAYRAAGVHTWQSLMVGGRPWSAPPLNAYVFARAAWDGKADPVTLTGEFARLLAGAEAGEALQTHYLTLADAYALALDFGPDEAHPAAAAGGAAFLDNPPTDMGDPWHASPEDLDTRLGLRPIIDAKLDAADDALGEAKNLTRLPEAVDGVAQEFALTRAWFAFHFARLKLYLAVKTGASPIDAAQALEAAYLACDAADNWARQHIEDARYRDNTLLLHWLFWRLRLDKIREDMAREGPERDAIRREREADMAERFARAATLWQ